MPFTPLSASYFFFADTKLLTMISAIHLSSKPK